MPLRKPFRRTGKRAGRFSEHVQGMAPSEPYFNELKKKYGDGRRTKVIKSKPGEITDEQLIENKEVIVVMTKEGYIKVDNNSVREFVKRYRESDFIRELYMNK